MKENFRIQLVIVCVGACLLAFKFLAYWLTHSATVLTDALESIVNVVAGFLGLYSLHVAAMPKDENHPYGHGKVEFISAGVEGTLISVAGLLILVKSVETLLNPQPLESLDWGIYITAAAGLINYLLGAYAKRRGQQTRSLALVASGKHLQSDAYSTVGLVVGLAAIYFTNFIWLDSVVALLFGFIILYTGYGIVKESVAGIMDEVDYELVERVVRVLDQRRRPDWIDIHNLRIIKYGGALHIDCHLTVPFYFDVIAAHREVDSLEELLENELKTPIEFFIHVDACVPTSCALCQRLDCEKRRQPFAGTETWTPENVMRNQKHGLYPSHSQQRRARLNQEETGEAL